MNPARVLNVYQAFNPIYTLRPIISKHIKTQMRCCRMRHLIRVVAVYYCKIYSETGIILGPLTSIPKRITDHPMIKHTEWKILVDQDIGMTVFTLNIPTPKFLKFIRSLFSNLISGRMTSNVDPHSVAV